MLLIFVLIVIAIFGVYLSIEKKNKLRSIGPFIAIVSSFLLAFHSVGIGCKERSYNDLIELRYNLGYELFLLEMKGAKNLESYLDLMKRKSDFNIKLTEMKKKNKSFILDVYIDDRIYLVETL